MIRIGYFQLRATVNREHIGSAECSSLQCLSLSFEWEGLGSQTKNVTIFFLCAMEAQFQDHQSTDEDCHQRAKEMRSSHSFYLYLARGHSQEKLYLGSRSQKNTLHPFFGVSVLDDFIFRAGEVIPD